MKKNTMVWLFTFAVMLTLTSVGRADTISVGVSVDGGAISTIYGPAAASLAGNVYSGTAGNYSFNGSVDGAPPNTEGTLDSNNISVQYQGAAGAHTLTIYVTDQNITYPLGVQQFFSSFTSNTFTCTGACTGTSGISLGEATFVSASNALFGGTSLASHTFTGSNTVNGLGVFGAGATTPNLGNPSNFSLTEVYTVSTDNAGEGISGTIDVPEPGTIFLFGGGLFGVAGLLRRKILS